MLFCVSVLMMPWNAIEMKSNKSGTQLILLPPLCFVREMYESEEQMEALEESRPPEVGYFLENFMPGFELTLDELQ